MICLQCDNESFSVKKDAEFKQIFKGKTLRVKTPGMVCDHCGRLAIGNGQVDDLVKATKREFRKQSLTRA